MKRVVDDFEDRLRAVMRGFEGDVAVAVGGGIDSLTLAAFAHAALAGVTMFHAVSAAVPGDVTARVERVAEERGWRLEIIDAGEFDDPRYRANPVDRCFFCKTNLYASIARQTSAQIVSAANMDDLGEYRPGLDAAREHGVRHPYLEAGIEKRDVRRLAVRLGLGELSELPAAPCLSSRVETGISIRADVLRSIHSIERGVSRLYPRGIVRCRVRQSGVVIELDPETLAALDENARADLARDVEAQFEPLVPSARLRFAPYRSAGAAAIFQLDRTLRQLREEAVRRAGNASARIAER